MTIKEISNLSGCSRPTVNRIAKELYPESIKNGRKADFTDGQCIKILDKLRKQGFMEASQNKKVASQNEKVLRQNGKVDRDLIAAVVAEVIKQMLPYIQPRTQAVGKLPELPPVDYRAELNAIVRAYASKNDMFFGMAWNAFYSRVYYRLHVNIVQRANNAGLDPLDWAEQNGYLEQLYQLAKEEF